MGRQQETAVQELYPRNAVTIPEPTTRALEEPSLDASAEGQAIEERAIKAPDGGLSLDENGGDSHAIRIPSSLWIMLGLAVALLTILTAFVLIRMWKQRKEEQQRYLFNERRKKRLRDIGFSQNEFELLMERNKRRRRHR